MCLRMAWREIIINSTNPTRFHATTSMPCLSARWRGKKYSVLRNLMAVAGSNRRLPGRLGRLFPWAISLP